MGKLNYFAVTGAIALGAATVAFAGEYNSIDALSLVKGAPKKVDCSVSAEHEGKTYCFAHEAAKAEFMKDAEGNVAKAEDAYQPCRDDPSSYAWCD